MGAKAKNARKRLDQGNFYLPSPEEVQMAMTPAGAWTAAQLAEWGVAWPPRQGWRRDLEIQWEANHKPNDFSSISSLIRAAINSRDIPALMTILSNNISIVLTALDIAAVSRAAYKSKG